MRFEPFFSEKKCQKGTNFQTYIEILLHKGRPQLRKVPKNAEKYRKNAEIRLPKNSTKSEVYTFADLLIRKMPKNFREIFARSKSPISQIIIWESGGGTPSRCRIKVKYLRMFHFSMFFFSKREKFSDRFLNSPRKQLELTPLRQA